jgi:hypothetical protein
VIRLTIWRHLAAQSRSSYTSVISQDLPELGA